MNAIPEYSSVSTPENTTVYCSKCGKPAPYTGSKP